MGRAGTARGRTRDPVRARPIDRGGARQPERFDPARAHLLGNPERERWLPYARVRELLDVPASATVVDFGAGTGALAIPLAYDFPDCTIVALDEQSAMLDRLKAAAGSSPPPNLIATTGADGAAVAAASAARLLAVNVLHEAGDDALAEMYAMLAPDGFALFVDWRSDVERGVGPPAAHVYTEEEARERLERAGFEVASRDEPQFPYHFVLEGRHGRPKHGRESKVATLRAFAGMRVTIATAGGTYEGYLDAAGASESSVTILLFAAPGGSPAEAIVIDLDAIESISEA